MPTNLFPGVTLGELTSTNIGNGNSVIQDKKLEVIVPTVDL
jgi:hypothetical protein